MINIIDKKIIDLLNKNGRMSAMDMAKTLNVSKGTVRNRLIGLYKENIIFGYNARVRYKMLGMDEAIVGFEISPEFYTKALNLFRSTLFPTTAVLGISLLLSSCSIVLLGAIVTSLLL